jgi:hypothetical protein
LAGKEDDILALQKHSKSLARFANPSKSPLFAVQCGAKVSSGQAVAGLSARFLCIPAGLELHPAGRKAFETAIPRYPQEKAHPLLVIFLNSSFSGKVAGDRHGRPESS